MITKWLEGGWIRVTSLGPCNISAKTRSAQNEVYLQACVALFVSWKQPLPVGSLIIFHYEKFFWPFICKAVSTPLFAIDFWCSKGNALKVGKCLVFFGSSYSWLYHGNSWGWKGRRGREIRGRLSSSSPRGSCHPRQEIFQDETESWSKALLKPSSKLGHRPHWSSYLCRGITGYFPYVWRSSLGGTCL